MAVNFVLGIMWNQHLNSKLPQNKGKLSRNIAVGKLLFNEIEFWVCKVKRDQEMRVGMVVIQYEST